MHTRALLLSIVAAITTPPAGAGMLGLRAEVAPGQTDCRIIEEAARANLLPVGLLVRLLWAESHLQADALSAKGARGIAQFMPETAVERGLLDPSDPAEAIPQAARLLAELDRRFENTGLAIAAYNAGSKRVGDWLANGGPLPKETHNFVLAVTGHSPDEWAGVPGYRLPVESQSCLALLASLATQPDARPRASSGALAAPLGRISQYDIGYQTRDRSHDPRSNSQYYIGYRKF